MEPIIVQWLVVPEEGPYVWVDTLISFDIEDLAVLVHIETGGVLLGTLSTIKVIDMRILADPFQKPFKKRRRWWFLGRGK